MPSHVDGIDLTATASASTELYCTECYRTGGFPIWSFQSIKVSNLQLLKMHRLACFITFLPPTRMSSVEREAQPQGESSSSPSYSEKNDGDTVIGSEEVRANKSEEITVATTSKQAGKLDPGPIVNDQTAELKGRKLALVLLGLVLSVFLAALDQTIISTALPKIATEFDALDQIAWVGTSYMLTSTCFQ
ncbi:hypothetical protein BC937DRAFT_95010, partial [Endogone sp. FLAS-F59071]